MEPKSPKEVVETFVRLFIACGNCGGERFIIGVSEKAELLARCINCKTVLGWKAENNRIREINGEYIGDLQCSECAKGIPHEHKH